MVKVAMGTERKAVKPDHEVKTVNKTHFFAGLLVMSKIMQIFEKDLLPLLGLLVNIPNWHKNVWVRVLLFKKFLIFTHLSTG